MTRSLAIILSVACLLSLGDAFMQPSSRAFTVTTTKYDTSLNVFGKKKKEAVDLSDIESRDMTREEMLEMNAQNEDIMNMELQMMTGFSLVLSAPILYLCWVAFFSD